MGRFDEGKSVVNDKPIQVSEQTLPATLAAGVRYLVATGVAALVSSDIIPAESAEGIIGIGIAIATVAYGLWKTNRAKKQLIVTAEAAPNSIAVVK